MISISFSGDSPVMHIDVDVGRRLQRRQTRIGHAESLTSTFEIDLSYLPFAPFTQELVTWMSAR